KIATLARLESTAAEVRRGGQDTKWRELSQLLDQIFSSAATSESVAETIPFGAGPLPPHTPSPHQKLVIFTEHRDTLDYLRTKITPLLGRDDSVVARHAGVGREERRKAQESSLFNTDVQVLLATDA